MMNLAGFPKAKQNQLWTEAAGTATKIDNMLIYEGNKMRLHKQFFGTDLIYMQHLQTFGKIAITTNNSGKDTWVTTTGTTDTLKNICLLAWTRLPLKSHDRTRLCLVQDAPLVRA